MALQNSTMWGLPLEAWGVIVPAASAIAGIVAGAWLAGSREERRRRLEYRERQLREFYSPLLAIRLEIRALSEYRVLVQISASKHGSARMERLSGLPPEEVERHMSGLEKSYLSDIPYHNKQLSEVLLPAYHKMQDHFRDFMYLADSETVKFFNLLVQYIEGWNLLNETELALEVRKEVAVKEKELQPFYDHLEKRVQELKAQIASGKPARNLH